MTTFGAFEELKNLEELRAALDPRTLEILERRRKTKVVKKRGWLVRRALVIADSLGLLLAFVVAEAVYGAHTSGGGALGNRDEIAAFAVSLPVWVVAAKIYGLYDRDEERTDHSTADDFVRVFHLITVGTWLLYAGSLATGWVRPEFGKLFLFWLLATLGVTAARAAARAVCRRQIQYLQNTIIVGAGDVGQAIARKLLSHSEYGINLVGFVDDQPKERIQGLEQLTLLGGLDELPDLIELLDVDRVLVAFTNGVHEDLLRVIDQVRLTDIQIDIVPRLFDGLGPSVSIHAVEGIPLISLPPSRLPRSSMLIKRTLDVVVALIGLLVLSPLLLVIAVGVKANSAGPVFYRHRRVGRGGTPMRLLKFRTMYREMCRGEEYAGSAAEAAFEKLLADPARRAEFELTFKLKDDPRVTSFGRSLRRWSLDELPQLWNVLRGDISLVGPRALTAEELQQYYGDATPVLLAVRPGVTGYWQINGRSHLEYQDRVRLDLAYLGGWSLGLDLMILARTARVVVGRRHAC